MKQFTNLQNNTSPKLGQVPVERRSMKMSLFFALCSLLILSACNNGEAVYITEPTEIDLFVDPNDLTASTANITVTPVDDRAYFYIECQPVDKYEPGTMDKDFMMLTMDSVYIEYLQWRYYHLVEGETYVAPFSSHSLKYGVQDVHFKNLEPMSEYMVFAFCVNPISNQPMGELFYHYFVTDSLRNVDLTFQLKIEGHTLYIMPSNDHDYYVLDYIDKPTLENAYDNNPAAFLVDRINDVKTYNILEFYLNQNATLIDLSYLTPNTMYVLAASAYDGEINSEITTAEIFVDSDGLPHLIGSE